MECIHNTILSFLLSYSIQFILYLLYFYVEYLLFYLYAYLLLIFVISKDRNIVVLLLFNQMIILDHRMDMHLCLLFRCCIFYALYF